MKFYRFYQCSSYRSSIRRAKSTNAQVPVGKQTEWVGVGSGVWTPKNLICLTMICVLQNPSPWPNTII